MSKYIISAGTTADLSYEHFKKRDISYIDFYFNLDGVEYVDDLGRTMSFSDFYKKMAEGAMSRTSQPNVEQFISYFTPFLENGQDVIHLSLSSALSGEFNSARLAKEELEQKYPKRKIFVIDSKAASGGFGLLIDKLADLRDEGMNITELASWTEVNKLRLNHWFYTTDLKYFVRGGRLTKLSGFMGNLLHINPLLHVNELGELIPKYKVVGQRRVQIKTLELVRELADHGLEYADKVYINHAEMLDDALSLERTVKNRFKNVKEVVINYIGTTIGAHTGPGTVAIFFWGKRRDEN